MTPHQLFSTSRFLRPTPGSPPLLTVHLGTGRRRGGETRDETPDHTPPDPLPDPLADHALSPAFVFVRRDADPQLFGYPELPTEYTMLRDPRKGWWDQDERRNFGEIVRAALAFLSLRSSPAHSLWRRVRHEVAS
jgi:hypothetical protein